MCLPPIKPLAYLQFLKQAHVIISLQYRSKQIMFENMEPAVCVCHMAMRCGVAGGNEHKAWVN